MPKICSMKIVPESRLAKSSPKIVITGTIAARSACRKSTRRRPHALGLGGPDVVLAEGLHHLPAGEPGVVGDAGEPQHQPGQHHPADGLERVLGDRVVADVREEVPAQGEVHPGEQDDHVVGDGRPDQRPAHQEPVQGRPAPSRGHRAHDHAEGQVDRGPADGDGDRGRVLLLQVVPHRVVGHLGDAQAGRRALVVLAVDVDVAPTDEESLDPRRVVRHDRLVEAHLVLDRVERGRRALTVVQAVAVVARRAVAHALEEEHEHEDRGQEDDEERAEDASHDESDHPSPLLVLGLRPCEPAPGYGGVRRTQGSPEVTRWSRSWPWPGSITRAGRPAHPGADGGAMTRLVQVALKATDLDRAAAFYGDLLGASRPAGSSLPDCSSSTSPAPVCSSRATHRARCSTSRLPTYADRSRTCADAPRSSRSRMPIFTHEDDALGPAGTTEWQAFVDRLRGQPAGPGELRAHA